MDQSELIEQLKAGDESAFREIVGLWKDMVHNTVISIVQNAEDAEDITQEVFISVYRSVDSFRAEAKFSTWLYRIAISKALDHERKKKRKKRFGFIQQLFGDKEEEKYHPVEFHHPGVILDNKEKANELFKALKNIPEKQRIAFTMSKLEGLSNQEIAAILDTTVYSVESLMTRAKNNLKKELRNYYLTKVP